MKRSFSILMFLAFGLFAFSGCDFWTQTGSLSLSWEPSGARTIGPDAALEVASVVLTGLGPEGGFFEFSTENRNVAVRDLVPGSWTISAIGRNPEGTALAEGRLVLELRPREDAQGCLVLYPIAGSGSLRLRLFWSEAGLSAPSADIRVSPVGNPEGERVIDPIPVSGGIEALIDELDAGYYELRVRVSDAGLPVTGCLETVRILAGLETLASFVLGADGSLTRGNGTLSWQVNLREPLEPTIAGLPVSMEAGETAALFARATNSPPDTVFHWFVDGEDSGSGLELALTVPAGRSWLRVDLAVMSPSTLQAGSSSALVPLLPRVRYGAYRYSTALMNGSGGVEGLNGCRDVAFSADGSFAAAVGRDDNDVSLWKPEAVRGTMTTAAILTAGTGGFDAPLRCVFSPDGALLAVASSGNDRVFVLRREGSGYVSAQTLADGVAGVTGLDGVGGIAFSPDGDVFYALGRNSGALVVFRVFSGVLSHAFTMACPGEPEDALALADGVAVSCYARDAVVVYRFDAAAGTLVPLQSFVDGTGGVDGLNGAGGLSASSDGRFLYVAGYYDNAVSWFRLDAAAGEFVYDGCVKDGQAGASGLRYARHVAIGADGLHAYVAGGGSDAVAVFDRDPATGSLVFETVARNGVAGVSALDGPRRIAVSPDGGLLAAACSESDSVVLFEIAR